MKSNYAIVTVKVVTNQIIPTEICTYMAKTRKLKSTFIVYISKKNISTDILTEIYIPTMSDIAITISHTKICIIAVLI